MARVAALAVLAAVGAHAQTNSTCDPTAPSVFSQGFNVTLLNSTVLPLSAFAGQVFLLTNTASF